MAPNFTDFFKRYEAVVAEADKVFDAVRTRFAENVRCEKGCSDCCHALFDLTLVEAMFLNEQFLKRFSGREKNTVLERADEADRLAYRLKREAFKATKEGRSAQEILTEMAKVRVRCPLLDDDGLCLMYDVRPATCRIYGVPTAIGGQAHTCGKSGFEKGKAYPTVYLDRIQDKLYALSHELAESIATRFKGLGEVLVPVSQALLTEYGDEYLGIGEAAEPAPQIKNPPPAADKALKKLSTEAEGKPAKPAKPAKPVGKLAAKLAAKSLGKGLPECSGCSPDAKKGGCAGCSPKSFTIGQAPAKPAAKKSAPKKPAAQKAPAKKGG